MLQRLKVQCISFILLCLCFALIDGKAKIVPPHNKIVVCYISTWAIYRPSMGAYSIENFDANLCTHAVYAFAGLDIAQAAIKSLDPWQDLKDNFGKGGYERLTALKQTHSHLKVSLAIGGWNEGSKNYSVLAADPIKRSQFVKQVTNFVRKYNFDGLDLDWEYPTRREGQPEDRENFVQLVKQLRQEFDAHNLLLTTAIGAQKSLINEAYDIKQLSKYLDFIHIMCYDYHGSWEGVIGYNAPLHGAPDDSLTVEYTVNYLLQLGAPASKLVLGVPFYGRTFRTLANGKHGEPALNTGFQGPYTREDGFLGYNEICLLLANKSAHWTQIWDGTASQMLAYSERDAYDGTIRVITYDTSRSIANKVLFAMAHNLAGIMIWSVDTDDFRGACSTPSDTYDDYKFLNDYSTQHYSKYLLLHTINEAASFALDAIRNGFSYEQNADEEAPHTPNIDDDDDVLNEIPHGDVHHKKSSSASVTAYLSYLTNYLLLLYSVHYSYYYYAISV